MLHVHLFVLHVLVFVLFSSTWCRRLAVVCDCGTPWNFSIILFLSDFIYRGMIEIVTRTATETKEKKNEGKADRRNRYIH